MISRSHRFLFIHVPKTGGNNVAKALLPFAEDRIRTDKGWQDGVDRFNLSHPELPTSKHSTFKEYLEVLGDEMKALHVFATIRDPWSRMLSLYFSPHRIVDRWDREAFIDLVQETTPALTYLTPDGSDDTESITDLGTDVLMRFDHLADDFSALCHTHLGLTVPLPRANTSNRPSLSTVYDAELVDLVAQRFATEIELFGFSHPAKRHQ